MHAARVVGPAFPTAGMGGEQCLWLQLRVGGAGLGASSLLGQGNLGLASCRPSWPTGYEEGFYPILEHQMEEGRGHPVSFAGISKPESHGGLL